MLWWPDEFCERLANRGRFIIRYDTATPATRRYMNTGNPLQDMADDAIRVLDGCGLSSAHVGGMIAQLAALNTRRVASVTVISSSPFVEGNTDLPGVSPAYLDHFAQFHEANWTDRAEAIRFLVEDSRSISGWPATLEPTFTHERRIRGQWYSEIADWLWRSSQLRSVQTCRCPTMPSIDPTNAHVSAAAS